MQIERRRERIERRLLMAGEFRPRDADRSENALFDRCFEVAEAARELETVAGVGGSSGASAAALGCLTSAFESLANSMLALRGVALRELPDTPAPDALGPGPREQVSRLLFTIDQNMRFAAHAADLARESAAQALEETPRPANTLG